MSTLAPRGTPLPDTAAGPIFVGRAHELRLLEALLAEAREGTGRLALVTGEPGIGKSRLADEVARRAELQGWLVAWGRTWEGAGTPAFWPWTQVFRRLEELKVLPAGVLDAPAHDDADLARFKLYDAVAAGLARASRERPLLVILDDLHAADAATLALLHFVARMLRGARVLVLATARGEAFAVEAQTPVLLANVAREATRLPLGRLAKDELTEWTRQAGTAEQLDRLWSASEGNPLFVVELLAAAGHSAVTQGIAGVIKAHLQLAPPAALALLEAASVLGREPSVAALEKLVGLAALPEALSTSVLHDLGDGRLRFSHVLIRDELYARLEPQKRRQLHRAAAEALPLAEAAHHALLSAGPDDAAWAFERVRAAMRDAAMRLAHEDAARLGQRAVEALSLQPLDACALRVEICEALVLAGDVPGARPVSEHAADLAAKLQQPELLARAALARTTEITFAQDDEAVRILQLALDVQPAGDSVLRAQLMGRLSIALTNSPDHPKLWAMREESIAMARRLKDEKTLLFALLNASGAFNTQLTPQERFAQYSELIDLAERLGSVARVAPLLCWHVASCIETGDLDRAEAAAERVVKALAPFPQPHYQWRPPLIRAVVAALKGRFAEAEQLARESFAISSANGVVEGIVMFCIFISGLPYLRDDQGPMPELYGTLKGIFTRMPTGAVFFSIIDAAMGHHDEVRAAFATAEGLGVERINGAEMLGWVIARAGIKELAPKFHALAVKAGPNYPITFGPGGFCSMGPTSLMLARLELLMDRKEDAIAHLREALVIAQRIKSPPLIAQAALLLAEQTGEAEPARTAAVAARACGLDALAERAEQRAQPPEGDTLVLKRDGELWRLGALLLKDGKGFGYLEALMQRPHAPVHVLELSGSSEDGDAGPVLDEKARRAYQARARELQAELDRAADNHDPALETRARRELEALGDELSRALGLSGRERRAGSLAERARINVQRRLREAIRKVAEQDPKLGKHFELSVRTGLFCVYAPTWPG